MAARAKCDSSAAWELSEAQRLTPVVATDAVPIPSLGCKFRQICPMKHVQPTCPRSRRRQLTADMRRVWGRDKLHTYTSFECQAAREQMREQMRRRMYRLDSDSNTA